MLTLTRSRAIDLEAKHEREFIEKESRSGIFLIAVTALALLWANSPWGHLYQAIWQFHVTLPILGKTSLLHLINDGLMTIFFLVVTLEIKREATLGSLSSIKKAGLPVLAALGGMLAPACIYLLFTMGGAHPNGWGIPVATDVAFALAVLNLFGRRIPVGLKAFLTALAIADDVGAIFILGVFYASHIDVWHLGLAAAATCSLMFCNRINVRALPVYLTLGAALWLALYHSGVHPTIAGVIMAALIPLGAAEKNLEKREQQPLQRLEHRLEPISAWVVVPLFAFANAGVCLDPSCLSSSAGAVAPTTLAIVTALVVGKPLGIVLFSWLAVKCKIGTLPEQVNLHYLLGAGCLGGIGFTVSLFIASQAFEGSLYFDQAKLGVLLGSVCSVFSGAGVLLLAKKKAPAKLSPQTRITVYDV